MEDCRAGDVVRFFQRLDRGFVFCGDALERVARNDVVGDNRSGFRRGGWLGGCRGRRGLPVLRLGGGCPGRAVGKDLFCLERIKGEHPANREDVQDEHNDEGVRELHARLGLSVDFVKFRFARRRTCKG